MLGHAVTMPGPLDRLSAFLEAHRPCGEPESGLDDQWVWIVSECEARTVQPIPRVDQSKSSEQ